MKVQIARQLFLIALLFLPMNAVSGAPSKQDSLERALDLALTNRVYVESSPADVWQTLIRLEDWMSDLRFRRTVGSAGREGEMRRGAFRAGGAEESIEVLTLKMVDQARLVLKVKSIAGPALVGFAEFDLRPVEEGTLLTYKLYLTQAIEPMSKSALVNLAADQQHKSTMAIQSNLAILKRLAEDRGGNR